MTLDQNSSEPLYLQLRDSLAAQIAEGKLQPHDRLPSERELCRDLGVSRMTVRQATSRLISEGLLYTRPGKGIFVAPPASRLQLDFNLTGCTEHFSPWLQGVCTRIVDRCLVRADDELMRVSSLQQPEELVRVERVRLLHDQPFAAETQYFLHRLCPGLHQSDLDISVSPREVLRAAYGLSLGSAQQIIRARLSNSQDMERLALKEPMALLVAQSKTYLKGGELLEFSDAIFRGDCVHMLLNMDLTRWQTTRSASLT